MFETEKDNKKVTVLGKIFNSEEERRVYFREELRKHLPELKKMEGFPIGEDDDILNLSDPPFYTACPNPWLNDFIAEWEEEKKQLEVEGKRETDFEVNEPYAADVSEGKTNPIYRAHSYHTKVPHQAIMRYLLYYTQPGDIIFDGFSGTGMTGVASYLCSEPEIEFKTKLEYENNSENKIKWGNRHSILSDLSPVANFIAYNYNHNSDGTKIQSELTKILAELDTEIGWMYQTKHSDGSICKVNFSVLSEVFDCNNCGCEIPYFGNGYNYEENTHLESFNCPGCSISHTKKSLGRATETFFDSELNETIKRLKRNVVLINYNHQGRRYTKISDEFDKNLLNRIEDYRPNQPISVYKMMGVGSEWGDSWRRGYHTAMTHAHHFFTRRSFLYISAFLQKAKTSNVFHELMFLVTSIIPRASLLHKFKKGQTTGTTSGTLYVSSLIYEYHIEKMLRERPRYAKSIYQLINKPKNLIGNQSATDLRNFSEATIDYIFTDPPFGGNLMYSELNFVWESFLKVLTENSEEAIENKYQNKSVLEYQFLMNKSFTEYFRVLKPGKWMTVEFSNTSAAVWNGIQTALQNTGFVIANVASLDKKQGSFKAVNTVTAVKQDLVISCYKPSSDFDEKFKQHQQTGVAIWGFVEEHLQHLPIHLTNGNSTTAIIERSPKILFDRLIAFYVQKGLPVPIDAGKFQQGLRDRFIERDGMFFTNEQVQEYDKKKAENPEFIQLSILVSSEQDGVLWLKNLLSTKPMKYQDINPDWMQAIASVRKGDILPELSTILKENFLIDQENKWYTPDPEKETDLEKLRTKRLLKQFDTYKTEAAKPKGKKIKEVRVEALRVGFKQCYQDIDFQSIVSVGDKIPNNLLMEDEVLLQFYDIASNRV